MRENKRKKTVLIGSIALIVVAAVAFIVALKMDNGTDGEDKLIAQAKAMEQQEEYETVNGIGGENASGANGDNISGSDAEETRVSVEKSSTEAGESKRSKYDRPEGYVEFGGKKYCYYDDIETYMIIGTDDNGMLNAGNKSVHHGDFADFIAVAVINRTKKSYTLIQIDRDTMVDAPMTFDDGTYSNTYANVQICLSHWYGNTASQNNEITKGCVSDLLGGLEIDGYYTLGVDCIPKLNHAIGGVTVTIEDDFTVKDPDMKKGAVIHLSDKQAAIYVRSRMDVGDGENTSRMRRQRAYLQGYYDAVRSQLSERPGIVNDLYKEFMGVADTDLNGSDVSRIINSIITFENKGIKTFDGKHILKVSEADGEKHTQFLIDQKSVESVMTDVFGLEPYEGE